MRGDPEPALAETRASPRTPRSPSARKTRIAVGKAATAGDWSKIELLIKTDGATATIDAYPEIPLASGAWRPPPGTYQITAGPASAEPELRDGIRSFVMLEPPPATSALAPKQKTVDRGLEAKPPKRWRYFPARKRSTVAASSGCSAMT